MLSIWFKQGSKWCWDVSLDLKVLSACSYCFLSSGTKVSAQASMRIFQEDMGGLPVLGCSGTAVIEAGVCPSWWCLQGGRVHSLSLTWRVNVTFASQIRAGPGGEYCEMASARKTLCRHSPCLTNERSDESLVFDSLIDTGNLLLFLLNPTNKQ